MAASTKSLQRPVLSRVLRVAAFACFVALVLCCATVLAAESAHADASAFDYGGDDIAFIEANGSELASYSRKAGTSIQYQNGMLVINYVTTSVETETGFYLGADIDDEETWDEDSFFLRGSNGRISFELDVSCAGMAWPIVPYNTKDMSAVLETQYYLAIPPLEKIPGYLLEVKFVDGFGNDLSVQTIVSGEGAVEPTGFSHSGYLFQGWDKSFDSITENTVVTALWAIDEEASYTVCFEDGWGAELKTETVFGGKAATAPENPTHEDYVFAGWDPASFDCITEDLTVVATWMSPFEAARAAIAALPSTPKAVLGQGFENGQVNAACDAYNALADEQKAQLTDDERVLLAKFAIAVLPSDPFAITAESRDLVERAQALYNSLPAELQAELDSTANGKTISSGRSYGRYLETAVWALDSLKPVDNTTSLRAGTYTGQVGSTFNMGKTNSQHGLAFTVKSITVKDGVVMAIVEHSSNASQTLRLGGQDYPNLQTDDSKNSYYEIPARLNSTFHFSVKGKGATDKTDGIAYEMTITADESAMKPDSASGGTGGKNGKKGKTTNKTASATKLTATGITSRTALTSNAGNLSSLLRTNNGKAASKTTSKASAKSSGTSSSVSSDSVAGGANISELSLGSATGDPFALDVDLTPAVAGCCLLFVSLGLLGFVMRFVRRETAFG